MPRRASASPSTLDAPRFSNRLPRPLWIELASGVTFVFAVGLHLGLTIYPQQVAIREIRRLGRIVAATSELAALRVG